MAVHAGGRGAGHTVRSMGSSLPILQNVTVNIGEYTTPGAGSVLLKNLGMVASGSAPIVSWATGTAVPTGGGAGTDLTTLADTPTATARSPTPTLGSNSALTTITLAATSYAIPITGKTASGATATCTLFYQKVANSFNFGDNVAGGFGAPDYPDSIRARIGTQTGGKTWLISTGTDGAAFAGVYGLPSIIPASGRTAVRYADTTRPTKFAGVSVSSCTAIDFYGMGVGGAPADKYIATSSTDCWAYSFYPLGASEADINVADPSAHSGLKFLGCTGGGADGNTFNYTGYGVTISGGSTGTKVTNTKLRYFYSGGYILGDSTNPFIQDAILVAPMRLNGSHSHIDGGQFADGVTVTNPTIDRVRIYQADGNAGSIGFHTGGVGTSTIVTPTFSNLVFDQRAATVMELWDNPGVTVTDVTQFLTASGIVNNSALANPGPPAVGNENDNITPAAMVVNLLANSGAPSAFVRVFTSGIIATSPPAGWTKTNCVELNHAFSSITQFGWGVGSNFTPITNGATCDFSPYLVHANAFERSNNYDAVLNTAGYVYAAHTIDEIDAYLLDNFKPLTGGLLDLGGGVTVGAIDLTGALKSTSVGTSRVTSDGSTRVTSDGSTRITS